MGTNKPLVAKTFLRNASLKCQKHQEAQLDSHIVVINIS